MKHNPFVPREQRTASSLLTTVSESVPKSLFLAQINLYGTQNLNGRIVNDFNKAQPRAVHKLVKVHLLRTQSSQPFILRNIQL